MICSVLDSKINFSQNPSQVLETKPFISKEEQDKLTCCSECAFSYDKEAQLFKSSQQKLLPPWLQTHGTEATQKVTKVYFNSKPKIAFLHFSLLYLENSHSFYMVRMNWLS